MAAIAPAPSTATAIRGWRNRASRHSRASSAIRSRIQRIAWSAATDAPARDPSRRVLAAWHLGCNSHVRRHLVNRILRLAVALGLALLVAAAVIAPRLVTASRLDSTVILAEEADE